jgi:hypothetical protein
MAMGAPQSVAVAIGAIAFLLVTAGLVVYGLRSIRRYTDAVNPRFPG